MAALRAGAAKEEITPESPVPLFGAAAVERRSTGISDPLFARSLVLDDGKTCVGVVSIDSARCTGELYTAVRAAVVENGPLEAVVVAASHTHTGPYLHDPVDEATGFFPPEYGFTGEAAADTLERFTDGIVASVEAAHASTAEATLSVGTAMNEEVAINRRSDGGVFGHVAYPPAVADRRDPHEDIDPAVQVLVVQTEGTEVILYNYPLHPNTLGGSAISADFPGVVAEAVAEHRNDAMAMYVNGATGDVIHRYAGDREIPFETREAYMQWVGESLSESVLEAADGATPLAAELSCQVDTIDLPYRGLDSAILRSVVDGRIERLGREGTDGENPVMTRDPDSPARQRFHLDRLRTLDAWSEPAPSPTIVHLDLGGTQLLSIPGEPFVEHGLALKDAAGTPLVVAGYANDYQGYFPTRAAFRYGGYEVETARLGPGTIDRLLDRLRGHLR